MISPFASFHVPSDLLVVGAVGQEIFELAAGREPDAGAHLHHPDQAIGANPPWLASCAPVGGAIETRRNDQAAETLVPISPPVTIPAPGLNA